MLIPLIIISLLRSTISGYTVFSKPFYDQEKATEYFGEFLVNCNKIYVNEEEKNTRFEIFKDELKKINKFNSETEHAIFEEFRELNTGFKMLELNSKNDNDCVELFDKDVTTNTAPKNKFNWRDRNVVTKVKNQGTCGACWAFAATGVVEAQYALKHKQLVSLSAQQLVDCVYPYSHYSCAGGEAGQALDYLKKAGGQMLDADYSYTATVDSCKFDSSKIIAELTQCYRHSLEYEAKLKEVLYTKGPLAIGIDFNITLYNRYKGGIIDHTECGTEPNHAVLLVGYGITDDGRKYWIMKNSFGPGWGENGYFRLEMGTNACGIMTTSAISATVD